MPKHLADLRTDVTSLSDARTVLATLSQLKAGIAYEEALAEKEAARIALECDKRTADMRAAVAEKESALLKFIVANKQHFKRPRKIKIEGVGNFGLQSATKVKVLSADSLLAWLMEHGYEDCMKVKRSVVKKAIAKRIEEGCKVPYVTSSSGDIAVYTIDKSLLDAARKRAKDVPTV
jgi:phage host-nuclease inhibitor protein Gam